MASTSELLLHAQPELTLAAAGTRVWAGALKALQRLQAAMLPSWFAHSQTCRQSRLHSSPTSSRQGN